MTNDLPTARETLEKVFCLDAPTHEIKIGPDLYLDLPEGYRHTLIKQRRAAPYEPKTDLLALRVLFDDDPTPYENVFCAPFNFTAVGPYTKLKISSGYDRPGVPDIALYHEPALTRLKPSIKPEDIKVVRREPDLYAEFYREVLEGGVTGRFYHYCFTVIAKGKLYCGQTFFNQRNIRGVPVLSKDRDAIVRRFIHMFKTESTEDRENDPMSPETAGKRQKAADSISSKPSPAASASRRKAHLTCPTAKSDDHTDISTHEEKNGASAEHSEKPGATADAPKDSDLIPAFAAPEKVFCLDAPTHEVKLGPDLYLDLPEGYRHTLIKEDGPTPEFQALRVLFDDDPTPDENAFCAPFNFTAVGPLIRSDTVSGYDAPHTPDTVLAGMPLPTCTQPGNAEPARRESDLYAEYLPEEPNDDSETAFSYHITVVAKGRIYAAQMIFHAKTIRGVPVTAKDRDEIVRRFIRMFNTESAEKRANEPMPTETTDEHRKAADSAPDGTSDAPATAAPRPATTEENDLTGSVGDEETVCPPEERPEKPDAADDAPLDGQHVIFTDTKSDTLRTYRSLDEIRDQMDVKVGDESVIHLCVGETVRIEGRNRFVIPLDKKVVRFFSTSDHLLILFEDGTIKVPELSHPTCEVKMWAEVSRQVEAFTGVQSFTIFGSQGAPTVFIVRQNGSVSVVKGKSSYAGSEELVEQIEALSDVRDVFRYRFSSIVVIFSDGTVHTYGVRLRIPKNKKCIAAKMISMSDDFILQMEDASYVVNELRGVVHKVNEIVKAVSLRRRTYMLTDDRRLFELFWAEDQKNYTSFNNNSKIVDFWVNGSETYGDTALAVLYEEGYALKLAKSDEITVEKGVIGYKYENGTLSFTIGPDKSGGPATAIAEKKPDASLERVKALSLQTMEMIYRRLGLGEDDTIYQGEDSILSLNISRFDFSKVAEDPVFKKYAAETTDLAQSALKEMTETAKKGDIYYSVGEAAALLTFGDVVSMVELGHMLNCYKLPSLYMELGVSGWQDTPAYIFELDNTSTQFRVGTKRTTSIKKAIWPGNYGGLFRSTESKQDQLTLLALLLADEAHKFYADCDWLPPRGKVPKTGPYTVDPFYADLAERFIRWHRGNHHRFGAGFFKKLTAIEWIDDFLLSYFPPKYPESTIQNCIFIDDSIAECCHFALDRM